MIEIKNRYTGTALYSSDIATNTLEVVLEAVAKHAYLRGADLRDADLRGANLRDAYLQDADLRDADLRDAYLQDADLRDADLRGTKSINKNFTTPLYSLLYADGPITAFKLVNAEGTGPFNGGITYEVGKSYTVDDANTDEYTHCGKGINIASLDWVCREWKPGYRVLKVTHNREDIAAIPVGSDGKYRLHRCQVVSEIPVSELGLGVTQKKESE